MRTFFHGRFIYFQSFCQKSAEKKSHGIRTGFTPNKPTHYLLDYFDFIVNTRMYLNKICLMKYVWCIQHFLVNKNFFRPIENSDKLTLVFNISGSAVELSSSTSSSILVSSSNNISSISTRYMTGSESESETSSHKKAYTGSAKYLVFGKCFIWKNNPSG